MIRWMNLASFEWFHEAIYSIMFDLIVRNKDLAMKWSLSNPLLITKKTIHQQRVCQQIYNIHLDGLHLLTIMILELAIQANLINCNLTIYWCNTCGIVSKGECAFIQRNSQTFLRVEPLIFGKITYSMHCKIKICRINC